MKIMEFLIGPASGDFATDTWTLIGTILLCIVFGLIILLAWKFTFSRVFRLVTGSGLKVIRLCTAGGIYIPLLVWWGCHVASGEADLRQWAAFIALLIFLNYIPVNIVVHVVDHVAAYRRSAEFISRKEELERAKKKNREMKSLRKKVSRFDQHAGSMSTQERLEQKAALLLELQEMKQRDRERDGL